MVHEPGGPSLAATMAVDEEDVSVPEERVAQLLLPLRLLADGVKPELKCMELWLIDEPAHVSGDVDRARSSKDANG
jgi:hypothetical protein